MAFIELDNTAPPKITVPELGVVVGSRQAGRDGRKVRYLAVAVGAKVSKSLGLTLAEHGVSVKAGTGDDVGKIAITANAQGKFRAKRQKAGHYLLTVNGNAISGRFALDFAKFAVDNVRLVPASPHQAPMIIIKCPDEMRAVG